MNKIIKSILLMCVFSLSFSQSDQAEGDSLDLNHVEENETLELLQNFCTVMIERCDRAISLIDEKLKKEPQHRIAFNSTDDRKIKIDILPNNAETINSKIIVFDNIFYVYYKKYIMQLQTLLKHSSGNKSQIINMINMIPELQFKNSMHMIMFINEALEYDSLYQDIVEYYVDTINSALCDIDIIDQIDSARYNAVLSEILFDLIRSLIIFSENDLCDGQLSSKEFIKFLSNESNYNYIKNTLMFKSMAVFKGYGSSSESVELFHKRLGSFYKEAEHPDSEFKFLINNSAISAITYPQFVKLHEDSIKQVQKIISDLD